MPITETEVTTKEPATSGRWMKKWAKVENGDPTGSEIVVFALKVDDLDKVTFIYNNKSGSKTHSLNVYGSLDEEMPDAITDGDVSLISGPDSVANGATTEPMAYENDYRWLFLTMTGDAETDKFDAWFVGSRK